LERLADESSAEQDEMAYAVLRLTVEEALQALPEQYRRILTLRVEGHEVEEIARQTGRSKRTVERVLQDCRKRLADLLEGEAAAEPRP
jgi:RNA polymerase sigma factor (sigma-70 family)